VGHYNRSLTFSYQIYIYPGEMLNRHIIFCKIIFFVSEILHNSSWSWHLWLEVTNEPTLWRFLLEKLKVTQLINKFLTFYGTHKLITVFARVCHWSLSWGKFLPYFLKIHSHIFQFISRSSKWSCSLLVLWPKFCVRFSSQPCVCYMSCPSHPPWLDHSNKIWWSVNVAKLLVMQSSPASCHVFTLVQIFLSAYCSHTPSIFVLPLVWETKFHTYTIQHVKLQCFVF
jgi:hypothetical protein